MATLLVHNTSVDPGFVVNEPTQKSEAVDYGLHSTGIKVDYLRAHSHHMKNKHKRNTAKKQF